MARLLCLYQESEKVVKFAKLLEDEPVVMIGFIAGVPGGLIAGLSSGRWWAGVLCTAIPIIGSFIARRAVRPEEHVQVTVNDAVFSVYEEINTDDYPPLPEPVEEIVI